jgi:pimeloyl-ACP methyl ester carboxylesterase
VTRSVVALAFAVVAAAAGCGSDASNESAKQRPVTSSAPKPRKVVGLPGSIVDVGGHYLYFQCVGRGSPTVVLEAGFGGDVHAWDFVQPAIGTTTRTCSYDRAGLGASEAMPGVHDADDEIHDLEVLLQRARMRPPYVVVGHSYGGILVRLFAFKHPRQTDGVVLIDSSHPQQARATARALAKAHLVPQLRRTLAIPLVADGVALRRSFGLGRRVSTLGRTRLVVITAGEADEANNVPPPVRRVLARTWLGLQNELAALSPDHVHAVALYSDHFVQAIGGQPDVVTRAVRTVVRRARAHTGLPSCRETFRGVRGVRCL